MRASKEYLHQGKVVEVLQKSVRVSIVSKSACSGCHAKHACSASDMKDKELDVQTDQPFVVGDDVVVSVSRSTGFNAVWWGYVCPLVIVILSLIVGTVVGISEVIGALISLGILIPYYLILYLLNDRLSKKYQFKISKQQK